MMNPLEDPFELGRCIAACRGYAGLQRPEFGERLEASGYEVRRWEQGLDLGTFDQRRALAERAVEVTGAPPYFVGLSAVSVDLERRVEAVETEVAAIRRST